MELEPKITEVELIQDPEKNPLESQALKALSCIFSRLSRTDIRLNILYTVSQLTLRRDNVKNLGLPIRKLTKNIITEGNLEPLHEGLVPRWTENVLRQGKGSES